MNNEILLKEINIKIEKNSKDTEKLLDENAYLQSEKDKIVKEIILNDNMLSETLWSVNVAGSQTNLIYSGPPEDIEKLKDLFNKAYFAWLDIDPGIQLQIDDNVLSLIFDEPKIILPFAKKVNIRIDIKNIYDEILSIRRSLNSLEKIHHEFNNKI